MRLTKWFKAVKPQIALFAVLALAITGMAFAQSQTGDLYGKVFDEKKEPLPSVTLTLTGASGQKIAQSEADGTFRFVGLYPGEYSIKAELSGFSSVEQTNVGVRLGGKAQVELTLSSEVKETITVTAEKPLLNPRELNSGVSLASRDLEKVPTARDPWALLSQAPGVQIDRVNVGGNESGQQANFLVGGATASDNTFSVDGMIVSDMAAVGGSATYFDFGAYEEVQVITASADASIQTGGVTINQVSKRGTNEWRGSARYLNTEGSWQAPPKETNGNEIDGIKEYGGDIGGPIVKDHLWVWGSYGKNDIGNIVGVTGQLDKTELKDNNAKLNFQLGTNSGTVHYWKNDKLKFGRGAGATRSPETTWDQTTPSTKWKFEDTQLFGSNFILTGLYSHDPGAFTLHPKGGSDADVYLDDDGVLHGSDVIFDQTATIEQSKLDGSVFFKTGEWDNELKFGGSFRTQDNDSVSTLPHGREVLSCVGYGCDPGPDGDQKLVEWIRHNVAVKTEYQAAWVQDTFTQDRWTVTAGARYDKQTAKNKAIHDPGSPEAPNGLLPVIDFKGDNAQGLDWNAIVPRLSATYALGQDRRTLLRGTYSQYSAQLGQWIANYVSPTAPYSYVYYYFTDANHNNKFDPNEAGSLAYYYVYNINLADPTKSANRLAKNLKPYKTNEASFSIQHSFQNNFNVSANLSYRVTNDLLQPRPLIIDAAGVERPAVASDYVFKKNVTVFLPNGKSVTVPQYTLSDDVSPTGGNQLSNSDRKIEYLGINLGFQKPLSNHWSMRGNFNYGDTKLKVGSGFTSQDDPTNRINLGSGFYGDSSDIFTETSYGTHATVLINSRWSFNVNGVYQVAPERPWGFDLGANINGREGYPFVPNDKTSERTGLQLTNKLDAFRFDNVYTVDARVAKDVKIGDFGLTFSIEGFNLLNAQPVLERTPKAPATADGLATAYPITARLSPRVFRWGVAVHFN